MHAIQSINIKTAVQEKKKPILSKIKDFILRKELLYLYEVELVMLESCGYEKGCLLLLDTYQKVVVVGMEGNKK